MIVAQKKRIKMIDILGLFTLVNVLWALSVFCIIGAAFWIFVLYIVPLMKGLPIELFEIFLYVCDVLLFYGAHSLSLTSPHTNSHVFLAFLACLGVPCLYLFTLATHISDDTNNAELAFKVFFVLFVCFLLCEFANYGNEYRFARTSALLCGHTLQSSFRVN